MPMLHDPCWWSSSNTVNFQTDLLSVWKLGTPCLGLAGRGHSVNQVRNASGGRFGNRRIAACAPLRPTAIATRVRSTPDNTLGFGVRFLSLSRFGNACPLHEPHKREVGDSWTSRR